MKEDSKSRPDFAQALIHFTKPRKGKARHWEQGYKSEAEPVLSGLDVLCEIHRDGIIRGSTTESGFIKANHTATCFSEVPLSGIRYFAGPEKKYEWYGVAISKRSGFQVSARPVIYLPDSESSWIPKEERWRHVRFEPPKIDHMWEREWRLKGDLNLSSVMGFYFFVWSPEDRDVLLALGTKLKTFRGVLCMQHLFDMM